MAEPPEARPLRVVHIIGGLELGGAETLLYRLATHRLAGIEQEVVCLGQPDWYSARLQERGIPVHHLGMRSAPGAVAGIGLLRRLLRERGADVVQSWMYLSNLLGGLAARQNGMPVAWSIHNSSLEGVGLGSRLSAYAGGACASRLARHVINCSRHSSDLHAALGYASAPGTVIPNGYDGEAFRPDPEARAATRKSLGIQDADFLVGSVSRWHPHKDIPTFLRAVRLAKEKGVPVRALLVGRGLDRSNRTLAEEIESDSDGLVTLLGERNDVADLARALDLHILSSRSEAFPNVVAETMLSGTPNAVTDVGDAAFIVGEAGWVVASRDVEHLADAIAAAWREKVQDPEAWRARRAAARERIASNFSFDRMAAAYARVWREIAGRP